MSTDIKRLPADWSKDLGIEVLDPDGWRADGMPWGVAITEQDFRRRAAMSTMREVATPAPLDPSKVKAGDTVTLSLEGSHVTDVVAAWERNPASDHYRAYLTHDPDPFDAKPFRLVGNTAYSLTDHQPAVEPEPEWLFEFKGEEGPEGDEHWVRRFPSRADALRSMTESVGLPELGDFHGAVSFSIYSEAAS